MQQADCPYCGEACRFEFDDGGHGPATCPACKQGFYVRHPGRLKQIVEELVAKRKLGNLGRVIDAAPSNDLLVGPGWLYEAGAKNAYLLTEKALVEFTGDNVDVYELRKMEAVSPFIRDYSGSVPPFSFVYKGERITRAIPSPAFRARVLNAYEAAKPYPGPPTCWYSCRHPGDPVSKPIYKVLAQDESQTADAVVTTTKGSQAAVEIPTCEECAEIHDERHQRESRSMLIMLGGYALLIVAGLLGYFFRETAPLAVVAAVVTAGPGLALIGWFYWEMYQLLESVFYQTHRIRAETEYERFPAIKELWRQGWRTSVASGTRLLERLKSDN